MFPYQLSPFGTNCGGETTRLPETQLEKTWNFRYSNKNTVLLKEFQKKRFFEFWRQKLGGYWYALAEVEHCLLCRKNNEEFLTIKAGVFKDKEVTFPDEPLLQLLSEKRYDEAFPFVLPIFKAYYIEQHSKHVKTPEDMEKIQKILDTMTVEKWKKFFGLIEWNFGEADEIAVRKSIDNLVEQLCVHFDVNKKYAEVITAKILDMIESRKFEKDFLHSIVHVSEVKILFLEFAQEARVEEKLDPMHEKWDEIECSDVRNIGEKFLSVCAEYEKDSLEELVDEYIDGAYEQSHHQNHRQVKAYNYRVYKTCRKLISRFLKEHNGTLTQFEIEQFLENLTLEAEKVIQDKAKTYSMPFEDQDMVRKTIILLFQECYLAFDEGRKVDE